MKTQSTLNRPDAWSLVHFVGCIAIACIFAGIGFWRGLPTWGIFYHTIILSSLTGAFWEICDEFYRTIRNTLTIKQQNFWDSIFDPRGCSWLDLCFDIGGSLAGAWFIVYGIRITYNLF